MEKITEYVTVHGSADEIGNIVKRINEQIRNGYEPFGSPVYMGNNQLVQPMVKKVVDNIPQKFRQ